MEMAPSVRESTMAPGNFPTPSPWATAYLRDLFCLLQSWPVKRVLELAPVNWKKALENEDAQQRLAANFFRKVSLGELDEHSSTK